MTVTLAPTWRHAARRILVLLFVALLVSAAAWLVNGAPSPERRVRQNEIARFSPSLGHGLVQLLGETGLVVVGAWIARRWLRIRL